jgi:hypothetical protein
MPISKGENSGNGSSTADFSRTLSTQALGVITLDIALQRFVWHNRHHLAQIEAFLTGKGWMF